MAPEAKLYGFKVLKNNGSGEDAFIIKALDTVADLNEKAGQLVIHGVNLSLGGGFDPSVFGCGHTPLCQELRRLWRQGVLVVLAAGNEGYAVSRRRTARCRRTWTSRSATRRTSRRLSPSAPSTRPTRTPTASPTSRRAGRRPTGA